jgi:RNA-directed DNA polymerase
MSKLTWNEIDWNLIQRRISRQQRRVYKASIERNKEKIHAIQLRIICSLDSKLLAIRQVITNKKKLISHEKKVELAYQLKLNFDRKKVIISHEKSRFQSLNISNIQDQAEQIIVKLALEPEWEALFEPNSYGFRPGRSCHDLIATILFSLKKKSRYLIKVNLQKCFYSMDFEKLFKKMSTFNLIEYQLEFWLKRGLMNNFQNIIKKLFLDYRGMLMTL